MPGGKDLEAHLHRCFADTRFSGEWFVETDAMSALFETILIHSIPQPKTAAQIRRTVEKSSTQEISQKVREAAAYRWPSLGKAQVVEALAVALGWSRTRAKDFYYGDPRISLRAYEFQEIEKWLSERVQG
jgi:hypothetical protein